MHTVLTCVPSVVPPTSSSRSGPCILLIIFQTYCFHGNHQWSHLLCKHHWNQLKHFSSSREYCCAEGIHCMVKLRPWYRVPVSLMDWTCTLKSGSSSSFLSMYFILTGIIIAISQYSTLFTKFLGSDPVAVLATLILLAYTKLFRAVLTVMSFTYIQASDGSRIAVWLYDGNVRYLSGKHIPLFIFALL